MPKVRGLWTEEQLRNALAAVAKGASVKGTAAKFGIPRRTLRNHVSSGSKVKKLGRNTYLNVEQEQELCQRIHRLGNVGMPITPKLLRRSVFTFCSLNKIPHPFSLKNATAGKKWLKLFLIRHPDVARRKAQILNPARAIKLNSFIVNDYFKKLREVMIELDIMDKPQCIYNIDEKGCRLTLHHQQTVLAQRGARSVHLIAPEHAENVTIVACANALGHAIPPMVLFKGQRVNPDWKVNLPPNSEVRMTAKGSMTTHIFIDWINHLGKYKAPGKALLIFDGASSHLDANIVDVATEHNITLFCIPSNTTHALQPLDKSVFQAFESYWDDEVLKYWDTHKERKISKVVFGTLLSKIWPKALSPVNIASGFRATGIYPFDPNIIPPEAFLPSEITRDVGVPAADQSNGTGKEPIGPNTSTKPTPVTTSHKTKIKKRQQNKSDKDSDDDMSDESLDCLSSSDSEEAADAVVENVSPGSQVDAGAKKTTPTIDLCSSRPRSARSSLSMSELLETPHIEKVRTIRKKASNYKANKVVKSLFSDKIKKKKTVQQQGKTQPKKGKKQTTKTPQMGDKPGPSGVKTKKKESWYCFICNEDRVEDMISCNFCKKYVHELCAGVDKHDKIHRYECPYCEDD